jgi:CDGSH-type Zn-finger protein
MDTPHQAGNRPVVLDLEPGAYSWCACGLSKNQPFCDGSHKGSCFTPIRITLEEAKRCALCTCKQSKNGAYCDGTHKTLPA